jgi:hypothetical protein
MKNLIITISFLLLSIGIKAQVNINSLTGRKWKLDQLYGNQTRVYDSVFDSINYQYMPNNLLRIYSINTADSIDLKYTASNDSLIISDSTAVMFRYKFIYLNDNFLVYTKNYTDTATNTSVEEEFRFISTK